MAKLPWLVLGLGLKRWILLMILGIFFICSGCFFFVLGFFSINVEGVGKAMPVNPYTVGLILFLFGVFLEGIGLYKLARRFEALLKPKDENRGIAELAALNSRLEQGPKIVCIGGGTGQNCLLSGLRDYSSQITAVVSVADDGGSSGRLRSEFGMLPPGDIRNCLSALADAGPVMSKLMQYRFTEGDLEGHSFGNLLIMVLTNIKGSFAQAVREVNRIFKVRGDVLPATLNHVTLVATHDDGTKTTGQKRVSMCGKPIVGLELKPTPGETPPDVLERIEDADLIVIGPGSLYTSIMPNLLDTRLVEAVTASKARVVFVVNTSEQLGETKGYKVSDYLAALKRLAPGLKIDFALVNSYVPSVSMLNKLAEKGLCITEFDSENCKKFGSRIKLRDVIDIDNPEKHDSQKLAFALMEGFDISVQ